MKRATHLRIAGLLCLLSLYAGTFLSTGYAQARTLDRGHDTSPQIVGYFTQWGIYSGYFVKNLVTSGAASKLTVINYAFGNVSTNLQCFEVNQAGEGDAWADYQRPASANESVNGVADSASQNLRGNFNQLKELKALYPRLKVVLSLGGWTWSARFSDAALTQQSRAAFVKSCIDQYILGNLPQLNGDSAGGPGAAAGVFDGFDIDWEYPASAGNTGNVYRPEDTHNFTLLLAEFRKQLNALGDQTHRHYLLTIAAPAGQAKYSKIELSKIHRSLDWINLMTYDYHGPWETTTNFDAPLFGSPADPSPPAIKIDTIDHTVNAYLAAGIPPEKLVLGIPFYGHGWSNVPDINHGLYQGNASTQPAGSGTENYNVLKTLTGYTSYRDPITKAFWIFNGSTFWSYDDPQMIQVKMDYVHRQGLGGTMIWSLDGDDATGTLISTIYQGLR
jgi:chitinase